ncbi:hypothetical protein JZI60_11895 [Streptococcus equi subsp. equi]|uniref:hypothetical protein n=1 Tax=Streptococcus equi TaxID=1336 RepID=UPI001BDE03B6|nr:hypothetical protein [Streptococcus equi]MBT1202395.1 hypothetical protein [Streptococcus equi subsp. equi]
MQSGFDWYFLRPIDRLADRIFNVPSEAFGLIDHMNWNLLDLCLFDGGNDLVGLEVNGRSLGFLGG